MQEPLSCLGISFSVRLVPPSEEVYKSFSFVVDKGAALLKALLGKKMEGKREGETSATAHKGQNTEREHGLDAYLKAHNVEIGAVSTLEKRVRDEIYELEAEKVFALLERAKHTEPLKEAFDECETHLEELEDWLSVFSGKLSTMREDINTIEERNSELETSSRNNGILIETLTELLGELKPPSGLDDAVSTFSLDSEEDTAEVIKAVTTLEEYRLQLKGDKLEPYASMRALREQQEYCTRVSSDIINKTSAHMKSALDVSRALNTIHRFLSLNDCALTTFEFISTGRRYEHHKKRKHHGRDAR